MVDQNIISLPDSNLIEEEASIWVMRLGEGDLTDAQKVEFSAWINESALHQSSFKKLADFWGGLDFVEVLNDYAESDAARDSIRQERTSRLSRIVKPLALGAVAASIAAFCVVGIMRLSGPSTLMDATYVTSVGQQETIALIDGSQIILNTDSVLEVAFTESERWIDLKRGEAFFDVAHDENRPFSVRTPKGVVTAVGTTFSVRMNDEKLNVVVTEGRVALAPTHISPDRLEQVSVPQRMEISAGQSAIVDRGVENVSMVKSDALQKTLDWQDGELSFKGDTLETVVADLERYTDLQIKFGDDDIRQQKIVAYYKVGDIDRMFEALNVMAGIEVEYTSEDSVVLYRSN